MTSRTKGRTTQSSSDAWYRALTLHERLGAACSPEQESPIRAESRPPREDHSTPRLDVWRAEPPFADPVTFARRLQLDGLTERDLAGILTEQPSSLRDRIGALPAWAATIEHAYAGPRSTSEPTDAVQGAADGLLQLFAPLLMRARSRVRRAAHDIRRRVPDAPFDPAAVDGLFIPSLTQRLLSMATRTLVLELNVARVLGLLEGDTPEARFRSFVARLGERSAAQALLREYPVLARQAQIAVEQWVRFTRDVLAALAEDWTLLRETLAADADPGGLTGVHGGAGDGHRGGRAVMILVFASGFRLVYKPRQLAVEAHFQDLLRWLNARLAEGRHDPPTFRTLRVVDRGTYGWVEHVAPAGCANPEEVGRFYWRLGGLLALLYALESTDFHNENLMAVGEHPVLLDLETLFHPPIVDPAAPVDPALTALGESVARCALLPFRSGRTTSRPASTSADLVPRKASSRRTRYPAGRTSAATTCA